MRALSLTAVTLAVVLSVAGTAVAQSFENVAVVINEASPNSQRIGEYYISKRSIPSTNVIRIRTSTDETIERAVYAATIEGPIAAAISRQGLQDRILYIVLTKGIPLRISGTNGVDGTVSSVDSELTLLYRRMTGRPVPIRGRVANPYYLGTKTIREAQPFSHREHDIFLVTRLDAFTVAEVLALIDRGLNPASWGRFVLDQRGDPKAATGDAWLTEASKRLNAMNVSDRVTLEETPLPVRDVENVIGYYSWGSNDPWNQRRRFRMGFVPGALAATLVSTDARTFEAPPDEWRPSANWTNKDKWFAGSPQSLIADLIREGATGVAGNVAEPLMASTLRPDVLFPAYMAGFNLVESFYLALPHLSWQSVVVGDPLCRPFARSPLTPSQIEDAVDSETGLPALFSKRRLEVARAGAPGTPPNALALVLRAESHLARDDKAAARADLERAVTLAPAMVGPHLQLALLYEEAGEGDRAIDHYRRILELQPRNAVALNNLAYGLAIHRKAPADGLPFAQKAATLAPNDPTVLDTLGWIEHLLGHEQEAAKVLTTALRLGTRNAEIRLHAAIIYAAAGAVAAAELQLKEALGLDPSIEKRADVQQLKATLQK